MNRIETSAVSHITPLSRPSTPSVRAKTTTGGAAAVELSATGRAFLAARQALTTLPVVREDLVQRLQAQVAQGGYRVDGESCAAAMLAGEEAGRGE
jgi:flagellar biosynthesis anti-sigma factor FlgM